jgi:glycosyltransferase involved in cell wall biosynthesis
MLSRKQKIKRYIEVFSPLLAIPFLGLWVLFLGLALYARFFVKKKFDIGLGPHPLINNIYHKKALELYGYSARTFVMTPYFITHQFDYNFDEKKNNIIFKTILLFAHGLFYYKALYIYFNGTILFSSILPKCLQTFFCKTEPWFYKIARTKLILLPYGGDVHDLSHCPNLIMKNAIIKDYPSFQKQSRNYIRTSIDTWSKHADHIVAGCDWVWFLYHWDTLLSAHFSIDTNSILPNKQKRYKKGDLIKIFHAPNHVTIKGSRHFQNAITELKNEGYNVEIVFVQKRPNEEVLKIMRECDIIADQLIVGWYAMTALEGMALGKPVLCFLHSELLELYCEQGVIHEDEIPLVNCNFYNVKEKIKELLDHPDLITEIGKKSRKFVEKHHSIEAIGKVFDGINRSLGITPSP